MGKKQRISTDGGDNLEQDNPFGSLELSSTELEPGPAPKAEATAHTRNKRRETLLLRRLKSGRGGKVVTEVSGFDADPGTLDRLLKQLQGRMGTGGTRRGKVLELQGECRQRVAPLLEEKGYRIKGV